MLLAVVSGPQAFDVSAYQGNVNELILQGAGLREIFPARRIGEYNFDDGYHADDHQVETQTEEDADREAKRRKLV